MKTCNLDSYHIGAKALIFNNENKVLLLERDHPIKKISWDLPGGRVQKDESISETLLRELREEIGLETSEAFHPFGMFLTDIRIPIQDHGILMLNERESGILKVKQLFVLSNQMVHIHRGPIQFN